MNQDMRKIAERNRKVDQDLLRQVEELESKNPNIQKKPGSNYRIAPALGGKIFVDSIGQLHD